MNNTGTSTNNDGAVSVITNANSVTGANGTAKSATDDLALGDVINITSGTVTVTPDTGNSKVYSEFNCFNSGDGWN